MKGIAVAWVAALILASASARADDDDAAKRAEALAARAYDRALAAKYDEAIDLYLQSYAAAPSARVLLNVADVYDARLHDRARALAYYRRYLAEPDAEPDLARRAESAIAALEASAPPAAPIAPPREAPSTERSPLRTWAFVAGGAGLGAIAIGTVLGVIAKSKNDDAARSCNGSACTDPNAPRLTDDALAAAHAADVAFVAGGALLATGIVLYVIAPSSRVQVAPTAGARFAGVAVSGPLP